MWMRAVFAIAISGGVALGAIALGTAVSFAQPLSGDRAQYGYRALPDGPVFLNVRRNRTDFIRPGAREAFIVVAQITRAQAVRAAIKCNRGGEALKPPVRKGRGYVVRVLKGSYVRNIRVDRNGRCK